MAAIGRGDHKYRLLALYHPLVDQHVRPVTEYVDSEGVHLHKVDQTVETHGLRTAAVPVKDFFLLPVLLLLL